MVATLIHSLIDNRLTQDVSVSVQQVWLAGIGACITAETAGREWFSALVRRGEKGKAQALQQADEVIGGFQERFETIQIGTFKDLNKLEKLFQKPVMRGLRRLGIPSRKDIQHLARRVEELQQYVDEISRLDQAERIAMVKPG